MSEKSRYCPFLFHTGPSTQVNPSAIFSSFASRGTSLSKRGSRRTIVTGTDVGLLLGKAAYDQSGSKAARAITNKRTGCLFLTVLTSLPYGRMPGMFRRIRYSALSAVR